MTNPLPWKFPVLALGFSSSGGAVVALQSPLRIEAYAAWRKPSFRYIERILTWFEPATILVTHGTQRRWRVPLDARCRRRLRATGALIESLTINDGAETMGCGRSLPEIAARIVDIHPEFARSLAPFTRGRVRTNRARKARPLLSALTVAHAASVRHVINFG